MFSRPVARGITVVRFRTNTDNESVTGRCVAVQDRLYARVPDGHAAANIVQKQVFLDGNLPANQQYFCATPISIPRARDHYYVVHHAGGVVRHDNRIVFTPAVARCDSDISDEGDSDGATDNPCRRFILLTSNGNAWDQQVSVDNVDNKPFVAGVIVQNSSSQELRGIRVLVQFSVHVYMPESRWP